METATQTLHRLTSVATFSEETVWDPPVDDPRVVRDLVVNDTSRLPWFYKRYDAALPVIPLPRDLPRSPVPTLAALAGTPDSPTKSLDLAQLARLLFLCSGVVRTMSRPYATWLFRAAGSAGGRFPLEVYVAVPPGGDLPPGVHWYQPEEHALVTVGPPPRGAVPTVVVTGVPWRTGWRYRERGYRHVYWDAGTMVSQLLTAATSAGIATRLYTRFPDAAVSALVGADGVHEWPVAVVSLGDDAPALEATGTAVAGAVDVAPVEFPLVTAAQRAGDEETLGAPWPAGDAVVGEADSGATVDDVILRRGSQRRMDAGATLPAEVFRTALSLAMRGIEVEHWVAVHGVDGVEPGLYAYPDLTRPRRAVTRDELYHFCMDQGLGADAAFVVVGVADVATLTDRGYREVQLSAGMVEGRLHLAAYAMGAGASGMTFVDGLVPSLVGRPMDGLLCTCVGVPEYASKAGGGPGAPIEVRMVQPRM